MSRIRIPRSHIILTDQIWTLYSRIRGRIRTSLGDFTFFYKKLLSPSRVIDTRQQSVPNLFQLQLSEIWIGIRVRIKLFRICKAEYYRTRSEQVLKLDPTVHSLFRV